MAKNIKRALDAELYFYSRIFGFDVADDIESLEIENIRLRELLDSSFEVGEKVLVAELMSVNLDPYKHQIVINKGELHHIYRGQPLLDADGVMGQVVHVGPYTSTAVLITDTSHATPVQVNRNGLRTIALGSGTLNRLDLPYLSNNADVVPGDLLVTSGLGGRFPPGYPVATVTRIDRSPDEPFSNVQAEPRAHLDRSREVLLVWTVPNQLATPDVGLATADDEVTPDAAAADGAADGAADVGPLAALPKPDLHQLQAALSGQALGVLEIALLHPARHLFADGDQVDLH